MKQGVRNIRYRCLNLVNHFRPKLTWMPGCWSIFPYLDGSALALVSGVPAALSGVNQANLSIKAHLEPVDNLQLGVKAYLCILDAIKSRLMSWKGTS